MTKAETLNRYEGALNELLSLINTNRKIEMKQFFADRKMSQSIPTAMLKGGYITRLSSGKYKANTDEFRRADVFNIINIIRDDNKKGKAKYIKKEHLTSTELAEKYSIEELAEALKIKGCSAVIEVKKTISF